MRARNTDRSPCSNKHGHAPRAHNATKPKGHTPNVSRAKENQTSPACGVLSVRGCVCFVCDYGCGSEGAARHCGCESEGAALHCSCESEGVLSDTRTPTYTHLHSHSLLLNTHTQLHTLTLTLTHCYTHSLLHSHSLLHTALHLTLCSPASCPRRVWTV